MLAGTHLQSVRMRWRELLTVVILLCSVPTPRGHLGGSPWAFLKFHFSLPSFRKHDIHPACVSRDGFSDTETKKRKYFQRREWITTLNAAERTEKSPLDVTTWMKSLVTFQEGRGEKHLTGMS